jgi:hypothetical protein
VAFFLFALTVAIVGRKFLVHVANQAVLPIITLLIPVYTTIIDIRKINQITKKQRRESSAGEKQRAIRQKLTLWVVLAAYHTLATAFTLIPFSARVASILPLVREMSAVVIIWAQLSYTFTDIVFDAAKPFLKLLADKIPSSNFGTSTGSSFVSMLRMMRIINMRYETFLKSLMQDSIIVLIALIFLFTPWSIAYIGVIIVALLFPAFKSSNNILELGLHKNENEKLFWLEYWVCMGLLWALRCYGFNIWPSILLLSSLYLQHSLFQGASVVLDSVRSNWGALVDRHDRIQQEKDTSSKDAGGSLQYSSSR